MHIIPCGSGRWGLGCWDQLGLGSRSPPSPLPPLPSRERETGGMQQEQFRRH